MAWEGPTRRFDATGAFSYFILATKRIAVENPSQDGRRVVSSGDAVRRVKRGLSAWVIFKQSIRNIDNLAAARAEAASLAAELNAGLERRRKRIEREASGGHYDRLGRMIRVDEMGNIPLAGPDKIKMLKLKTRSTKRK